MDEAKAVNRPRTLTLPKITDSPRQRTGAQPAKLLFLQEFARALPWFSFERMSAPDERMNTSDQYPTLGELDIMGA
jgi:hypothetical protein